MNGKVDHGPEEDSTVSTKYTQYSDVCSIFSKYVQYSDVCSISSKYAQYLVNILNIQQVLKLQLCSMHKRYNTLHLGTVG